MKVSFLIPAYNEGGTIAEVIAQLQALPFDKQLIVVDDGSTDETPAILERLAGEHANIVVLRQSNQGKGAALRAGIPRVDGDIVVIHDADLEYDPGDIPGLIEPIVQGVADVVVTDGFTGNVALKLVEGVSQATLGAIRDVALGSMRGRVGGMLLQSGLRAFREEIDPERQGGAYLLGLRQLGVLAHGSFTRHGIARAIVRARRGAEEDLVGRTHRALEAAGALRRHDLLSVSDDTVLGGDP